MLLGIPDIPAAVSISHIAFGRTVAVGWLRGGEGRGEGGGRVGGKSRFEM